MIKFYLKKIAVLFLCLIFLIASFAQPLLSLTSVINGLSSPIQLVNAGDGTNRIFIVQQGGTILVYDQFYNVLGTFLTVSGISTGGERGLLSMAFPPGYENPIDALFGHFFVYYTNSSGDLELARYQVSGNANIANASSKTIVLTIPHPGNANHNGGTLHFGNDGYLYFATGDGGGAGDIPNNAQNGNILLGKMIRIAVNNSATAPFYTIPVDNPFISAVDTLHHIWAFGLRNPFRWAFDRSTHDMWIADVGQGALEEINYRPADSTAGVNYGWHCYEGTSSYNTSDCNLASSFVSPIYVYPNPGGAAITGGPVYRGTVASNSALFGYHLAADFYSGNIYKTRPNGSGGWITFVQNAVQTGIANFGEIENGEIYAVSLTAGTVYSVTVSGVLPTLLGEFIANSANAIAELKWKTSSEQNLKQFEIEYSPDGNSFIRAGVIAASNIINGAAYSFSHTYPIANRVFYRLKIIDIDGNFKYSQIILLQVDKANRQFVQPSVISIGMINVFLNASFNTLELISINGAMLMKQNIKGRTGKLEIPVSSIKPGTYIVQLKNNEKTLQQKIVIQ